MVRQLKDLIKAVDDLSIDERERLREYIDRCGKSSAATVQSSLESDLLERLHEKGLLGRITPRVKDPTPYKQRQLVQIPGRPLSESIVEERR